ncbi:MAG: septum formation initiator family protein [Chloroflexota bacterium]|nr:septum formation initiator family protein [Chloroflexota bacterium]
MTARLQRSVIIIGLVLATAYASVGFVRQERTVRSLTHEVAQRQQDFDAARQEQRTLTAEIAALNDPAHYAQYATLVARHTLMLTRPGETLLIVTWQGSGDPNAPQSPPATDWTALLRAANIPNP